MFTTEILCYPDHIGNFERTDPFSIEFWHYLPSGRGQLGTFASKLGPPPLVRGWSSYSTSGRSIGFTLCSDQNANYFHVITAVGVIPTNTWTHIIFTYNGNSLVSGAKCYVNNALKPWVTVVGNSLTGTILNTTPFRLGYGNGFGYLLGRLDEVLIHGHSLSALEVSQRYNGGVGTEGLLWPAYLQYHLNASSGTIVTDSSGNARDIVTKNNPPWIAGKLNNCLSLNGTSQYMEQG